MLMVAYMAPAQKNTVIEFSSENLPAELLEYANGGISVTARGDSTISSIKIAPDTWKEVASGKTERFETMLFNVVNGALKNAKKATQEHMASMMQAGGMGGLFGK